jgi:two-component system OmpR family sensor kinase
MFIKSIRFKIILWYALVLALTLSLFSIVLYHNFRQKLYENTDDVLLSRAEGVADSIDTYWETEKLEGQENAALEQGLSKADDVNFSKIAQRWVQERSRDPMLVNIVVQIFDAHGKAIASSKNIPNNAAIPRDIFEDLLKGIAHFDDVVIELHPQRQEALRQLTFPVVENDKVAYIVQVSSPLNSVDAALKTLKVSLFLLLPLTVFGTGVLGVFLAQVALKPVNQIIATIHQITAENLKLRISIPDTKDEIKRLADTFNVMLSRLEYGFNSQRQFIEDLAHELKTPLSVLRGELEVTLKKMRSAPEYERVLASSLEEVNRISKIVADLLLLARFDSSQMVLKMRSLDLGAMVQRLCQDIKILADEKNIRLSFLPREQIQVFGDEEKLKRLFINILDNAIKYTQPHGEVIVDMHKEGARASVSVTDTGVGIPQEELKYIFNRFYRVDKSRSQGGFGLGLSIAKSIAEAHHGKIEVVSTLHKGTIFSIFLPFISGV